MSAVASASLCWALLSVSLLLVSAEQKTITAESGQNVTLTCRAPNNNITVLEWSRADLGDENVLLYHNDCFDPDDQHPSFKNRVDLQDRQMKDGDVSLILKNVTINDAGTYECRVITTGTIRRKGANLGVSIIHLHVDPPGQTRGSVGLKVGLSVSAVLLVVVAVVGFLIYKRKQQQSVETNQPPVEVQQAEISQRFFQH